MVAYNFEKIPPKDPKKKGYGKNYKKCGQNRVGGCGKRLTDVDGNRVFCDECLAKRRKK